MDNKSGSMLELISIPAVVVTSSVIVVTSITWAFLDPTLEPHLRQVTKKFNHILFNNNKHFFQFNLSPEKVGLLFLLLSASYGVSSPGWGWLSDKLDNHWSLMAIGLFLSCIGLLLLGPSPILPFFTRYFGKLTRNLTKL